MNRAVGQCEALRIQIAEYQKGSIVAESPDGGVAEHLRACRSCSDTVEEQAQVASMLRAMPRRPAPPRLTSSLQIIASKERKRQAIRASWSSRLTHYRDMARLWADNLMRPLAVPAAGGLAGGVISTFCLLGLFTPSLLQQARAARIVDTPTGLITQARLAGTIMPLAPSASDDLTVELTVDEQGRMVDYRLPDGPKIKDAARRALENNLLFTRFTPATAFGQPVLGKVRISFHHAQIDIKG